jgi:carboxypeptidase C (cathepsin A)
MFFTSYRRTNDSSGKKRPVTFVFNGGPGSASLWLHLGLVGPKRVKMETDGFMPPPPYELVTNDESLLPESDLVLIDPVGTGYSRPEKPEYGKKFWGVQEDINSVGEFIRMYLTQERRWLSPVFVLGESYGGIRGSGLSQWLAGNGIGLNGLILISPYINGSVQDSAKANDQPFAFYLPTFAAGAWYHKKLDADLEKKPVGELVKEVQAWVYDEYLPALLRGDSIKPAMSKSILAKLHHYTGLSETFLQDSNLRISDYNWYKELLRKDRYIVGRYDARFKGLDRLWVTDHPDYDPSDSQITPPFTSTMNDYVRGELGYKTNLKYFVLGEGIWEPWHMGDGAADEAEALRSALHQNPYTKLYVAMGYYDLACPLGTVEQILNELELDPRLKSNIHRGYYPAGHMMYLDQECRKKLHADLAKFYEEASHPSAPTGSIR